MRKQIELLKYEPEVQSFFSRLFILAVHGFPLRVNGDQCLFPERHAPAVRLFQKVQTPQKRALSAPRRSDNGEHFPFFKGKAHILDDLKFTKPLRNPLNF